MICDFHTHHLRGIGAELLSTAIPCDTEFTSLELHPWHLPATFIKPGDDIKIMLSKFTALGEIGLDRLHGPSLEVQTKYLESFFALAADCRKPVIIHCVRAFSELFALLKKYQLCWAIHGFRAKPEILDEIWRRGGIVSLHASVVSNPALLTKLRHPQGKVAFESDDDPEIDLEKLISEVIQRSANPDLLKISHDTFMEFTAYGK